MNKNFIFYIVENIEKISWMKNKILWILLLFININNNFIYCNQETYVKGKTQLYTQENNDDNSNLKTEDSDNQMEDSDNEKDKLHTQENNDDNYNLKTEDSDNQMEDSDNETEVSDNQTKASDHENNENKNLLQSNGLNLEEDNLIKDNELNEKSSNIILISILLTSIALLIVEIISLIRNNKNQIDEYNFTNDIVNNNNIVEDMDNNNLMFEKCSVVLTKSEELNNFINKNKNDINDLFLLNQEEDETKEEVLNKEEDETKEEVLNKEENKTKEEVDLTKVDAMMLIFDLIQTNIDFIEQNTKELPNNQDVLNKTVNEHRETVDQHREAIVANKEEVDLNKEDEMRLRFDLIKKNINFIQHYTKKLQKNQDGKDIFSLNKTVDKPEEEVVNNEEATMTLKFDLIQNFQFENEVNNEELKPLIKDLYHKMSSYKSKEECQNMIGNVFIKINEAIYKNHNVFQLHNKKQNKYKDFYFQYFILNSQIQINILTKKEDTTNEYNQLLNIGYNYSSINYYIEYFIDEDKSIVLWYNNDALYQINFKKNNQTIFFLSKPYNHINKWDLIDNDKNPIQENITLDQNQIQQIQTTYKFLKIINNMPTITPLINTSLQVLKVNVTEGIKQLKEKIKKLKKNLQDLKKMYTNFTIIKNFIITNLDINFEIKNSDNQLLNQLKQKIEELKGIQQKNLDLKIKDIENSYNESLNQLKQKIEELKGIKQKKEEKLREENLSNLEETLTAIHESGFISNGEIQLKLMKKFEFEDINNNYLKEVVKILYDQMSSCHDKDGFKKIINDCMVHQPQYANGIYKLIYNKYKNFYFQYFIKNNTININILIKQNNNRYNKLLKIGYDFTDKSYTIEYFIDENKNNSIELYYNNNYLYNISFKKNDKRKIVLFNPDNYIDQWKLFQDCEINYKLIQDNITLDQNQIAITYNFLKTINNMPTITPLINQSLEILNVKAAEGIAALKKKSIDTTEFVNEDDDKIELKLITDLNFTNIQDTELKEELQQLIKDLYHEMSSCHSKEKCEEMIKRNMEHNYQYGNGIYKFKEDKYKNKYKDFYFQYFIFEREIQINILTKKQDNTYNQLLNIGYNFVDTIYFIEYFIDKNKNNSIVLIYNNNYLDRINFHKNNNRIFCLENPDEKKNKWDLKLNRDTIIQKNIILIEEQINPIQKTYEFLKTINNMATITHFHVKDESLQVLKVNTEEGIKKLQEQKIDTSGFVEDNDIQLKLITDLNFTNIQGTELKELQPLIKDLYDQMCSCNSTKACEEMIERNMEHQFKDGNGIYKFKDDQSKNKYENFYFTYYINNSYIQINILIKKQNTINEYNQLLNIGYNFIYKSYFIEYFIDEDKSFMLWYNNNGLYGISFRINNKRIFYLDKSVDENNKEDKWKLNLNQTIKENITLDQEQIEQIKTIDSFLKSLLPKEKQEE